MKTPIEDDPWRTWIALAVFGLALGVMGLARDALYSEGDPDMNILISFLELLLYLAIVILIAYAIKWVITGFMGWAIDPNVYKWAQVVVGLICLIAIVVWLVSVLGGGVGFPHFIVR